MRISEYAKQILLLMYKSELDLPGASFSTLIISGDDIETEEEDLIEAVKKVVGSDNNRIFQSLEYLESGGYISFRSASKFLDGSGGSYIGVKLTAKGVDFAEGVIDGNKENIKQAGLIINGDVNVSVESLMKLEAKDLMGFGGIVDFLKQFAKK